MSITRYPMQLSPVCKSTIWGGNRMRDCFGYQTKLDNIAEAWMLSAREDNPGFVVNGERFGERLDVLLQEDPTLLASDNTDPACPLLIKFIDARDKLSIQVHPDDAYAVKKGVGRGKTEMWIVLDATPGATLVMGTKEPFTEAELRSAIAGGTIEDMLRYVPVQRGDVFFIPAGLIHAIGAGILIAEIQQNCDTTYRVYDYNRRSADGSLRQLHIDDAVACSRYFTEAEIDGLRYAGGNRDTLADSAYFRVTEAHITDVVTHHAEEGFVSLLVTAGEGILTYGDEDYALLPGVSYFLPAGMGEYALRGCGAAGVTVLFSASPQTAALPTAT